MTRAVASFLVLVCITLTSCSRIFWVVPKGTLASGVRFEFFVDPDLTSMSSFRVREFSISELDQNGQETTLWSLRGRARIREIDYGVPPKGLTESSPARPLLPGRVYSVFVWNDPFIPPPGQAFAFFTITTSGATTRCPLLSVCWTLAAPEQ